jgi:prephenate dehydrogenase
MRETPVAAPPIREAGVVGLGLIGGSIALGLRAAWPAVRLVGVDRPEVLDVAVRRGVVDEGRRDVRDLRSSDLTILAAPVPAIIDLVAEIGEAGFDGVVTDVGSTKRQIMAAAGAAGVSRFVGGHPVAGGEQGGLAHGSADLFVGRPWVVVAGTASSERDVAIVEALAGALGAEPQRTDAATHDRTMAYVSHLPQLVAGALMSAAGNGCGAAGLDLAGRAFREMTRVAGSPADVWRGILATNPDFVAEALRAFLARLPDVRAIGDGETTDRLFADAQRWRRELADAARPRP